MSFSDFIIDEEIALKKRKEVEKLILKVVKKKLIDTVETEEATVINFMSDDNPVIKDTKYQVIVTLGNYKKLYRGMERAIYINIIKETNTYRETDYIQLDIFSMSEEMYAKTLDGVKNHFMSLVDPK